MAMFTLEAGPDTDIWRKPGGQNARNGLLLVPRRATSAATPLQKWIKTGVALYNGEPQLSTAACDRFTIGTMATRARASGYIGWCWTKKKVKKRIALREVCWIFADEGNGDDWVLDVSPLVARPKKGAHDTLRVEFT
ncbi:hypothetical protein F5X99DRAFT_420928 [Biscogniauxia marginata]|nr:hypothetical protein F5X99DRAFT_420928 [Biscogniauxia marginata]